MSDQNVKKDEWRDFREDYRNSRVPTGVLLILKCGGKKLIGFFWNSLIYTCDPGQTTNLASLDNMIIDEYKIIDMKKIGD